MFGSYKIILIYIFFYFIIFLKAFYMNFELLVFDMIFLSKYSSIFIHIFIKFKYHVSIFNDIFLTFELMGNVNEIKKNREC